MFELSKLGCLVVYGHMLSILHLYFSRAIFIIDADHEWDFATLNDGLVVILDTL